MMKPYMTCSLILFHLCFNLCQGEPGHQGIPNHSIRQGPKKVIQHNRPHPSFNHHEQETDPLAPEASAVPAAQTAARPQAAIPNPVPSLAAPVALGHRSSDVRESASSSPPQPNVDVFPYSGTASAFAAPAGPAAESSQVSPVALVNADPELSMDSPPAGALIARIHGNGVLGYVLFTPDATGNGRTVIKARITGSTDRKESFNWKVHSFPQQANALGCSSITMGQMLVDLSSVHGQLPADKDVVISTTAINLFAEESHLNILGRTLVVHGMSSGVLVCATILPAGKKKLYEAKFHYPISGSVKLMQTPTATGVMTEFLMYSDGSRLTSVHTWNIVQGTATDAEAPNKFALEAGRCASLNPSGGSLLTRNQAAPIPVSTEMPGVKGRSYQVISNLRSLETAPVNFLVIFEESEPTKILACAPLTLVRGKRAVAKFSGDNESPVQGTITLSQESPFDPTKIESNLKLNAKAYSYGIDLLPTIRRRRNEPKSCPNIKETIYNPFFKDPEEIPPEGAGTTDQFAVGDLSGKFGSLSGKDQEIFTSYDFNLPLYGQFSVLGRAVVIYAPDGPAISCTNIELDMGANLTTAYATFDIPLQGQFIFRQLSGECSSETYVYIEISKPDGPNNFKTLNHPWHIHEKSVNAGYEHLSATADECLSAGKHLNPFNVSTDCIYQRDCTMFTPHRCEVGDASGKLGPIDVPTYKSGPGGEPDVGKYYFIDTDLSLCGPTSIIGKSVVIHEKNFGSKRLTCANILEFKPRGSS